MDLLNEMYGEEETTDYKDLKVNIEKRVNELETNTYLNGEYDNLNVYLEIHPGAGGTESCDWADMKLTTIKQKQFL